MAPQEPDTNFFLHRLVSLLEGEDNHEDPNMAIRSYCRSVSHDWLRLLPERAESRMPRVLTG
jgi:hypothetical protein